ncbi:beta-1,4-glucuronosyltransferase WelK [Rhizorhapis sp. SPR117]|uniref:beta-1,4-glucuronosyltransferase WelK n=1 Tax=Rhizorhapis sp. SPR117 TaxID=2912611 RepID=UPI001F36EC05|nr:hypothetical protein [Rhizorhapis sp. SPR117]
MMHGASKICLAGSGGGHVRQLLDLEPVWRDRDAFFVTEDTALGKSLAEQHRCLFVPHVAVGQARLGAPFRMAWNALRNCVRSAAIILRERPTVLITTGAGAMFFAMFWARLMGAQIILIDSFARFERPSLFARIAAPLAHHRIVQSKALAGYWPRTHTFDPLKLLDGDRPEKQPLLFATVGATLPFDRLVDTVLELKTSGDIPEHIVLQIGSGARKPRPMEGVTVVETLPFKKVQQLLRDADIVICHGGSGSLITALRAGCRVISMPRLFERGEHYDNHQAEITDAFVARGLIWSANTTKELQSALVAARTATPRMATTDPAELIAYLNRVLAPLAA